MHHAAQRLAAGDDAILDIVLDCGFHNVSHFYKLFREQYGISPRRYRMKQGQIVGSA
jgi:AraC family cel operon transcriptional repressor